MVLSAVLWLPWTAVAADIQDRADRACSGGLERCRAAVLRMEKRATLEQREYLHELLAKTWLSEALADPDSSQLLALIAEYPLSGVVPVAREQLAERAWRKVPPNAGEAVIEEWLVEWAGTKHESEARSALVAVAWSAATEENSVPGFESFLHRFPDAAERTEAEERMAALTLTTDPTTALLVMRLWPTTQAASDAASLLKARVTVRWMAERGARECSSGSVPADGVSMLCLHWELPERVTSVQLIPTRLGTELPWAELLRTGGEGELFEVFPPPRFFAIDTAVGEVTTLVQTSVPVGRLWKGGADAWLLRIRLQDVMLDVPVASAGVLPDAPAEPIDPVLAAEALLGVRCVGSAPTRIVCAAPGGVVVLQDGAAPVLWHLATTVDEIVGVDPGGSPWIATAGVVYRLGRGTKNEVILDRLGGPYSLRHGERSEDGPWTALFSPNGRTAALAAGGDLLVLSPTSGGQWRIEESFVQRALYATYAGEWFPGLGPIWDVCEADPMCEMGGGKLLLDLRTASRSQGADRLWYVSDDQWSFVERAMREHDWFPAVSTHCSESDVRLQVRESANGQSLVATEGGRSVTITEARDGIDWLWMPRCAAVVIHACTVTAAQREAWDAQASEVPGGYELPPAPGRGPLVILPLGGTPVMLDENAGCDDGVFNPAVFERLGAPVDARHRAAREVYFGSRDQTSGEKEAE